MTMKIFQIPDKNVKSAAIDSSAAFLIAVVVYFNLPEKGYSIGFPLTILTIASAWLCPWQIFLALLFSAVGDFAGASGNFLLQMGSFAVAHIWYTAFFVGRYFKKVEPDFKLTGKAKGFLAMVVLCTAFILYAAFTRIVPEVPAGILRIGVGTYACIICAMLLGAMLQRSSLYTLGAVMFVFSDFILAWNMFTEPIPHAGLLIMIPYFLGQWLLYIRSTPFRVGPEMRLMRF